jgi:hypothetical protein
MVNRGTIRTAWRTPMSSNVPNVKGLGFVTDYNKNTRKEEH